MEMKLPYTILLPGIVLTMVLYSAHHLWTDWKTMLRCNLVHVQSRQCRKTILFSNIALNAIFPISFVVGVKEQSSSSLKFLKIYETTFFEKYLLDSCQI